jgi:hypothetical protein
MERGKRPLSMHLRKNGPVRKTSHIILKSYGKRSILDKIKQ